MIYRSYENNLFSVIIVIFWVFAFASCSSVKKVAVGKDAERIIQKSPIFSDYFVGFSLYDPVQKKMLASVNADKYFTPASNTKILTLAACLDLNQSRMSSFQINRSLTPPRIRSMGDPVFLHPDFEEQLGFDWLSNLPYDTLFIEIPENPITPFGPGWAWDDYLYYFQPERSWFPVYGNAVNIDIIDSSYTVKPEFFEDFVDLTATTRTRSRHYNLFNFPLAKYLGDTSEINLPFTVTDEIIGSLLTDTLYKTIELVQMDSSNGWQTIYGNSMVPVLSLMMQRSDNFLSEQLLYNAQLTKGFDTAHDYKRYLSATVFKDLPDSLIWVDASGLSRYNMITPRNLVKVLEGIYAKVSWEDIKTIFPTGGESGTIKNWYEGDPEPYIFAKTGTLRHNHCLSGFIVTDSGRKLIFSFMNNHYIGYSSEVKAAMKELLEGIRDSY